MLKIFSLAAALIFGAVLFNVLFGVQKIARNQISSQCAQAKAIAAKGAGAGRAGLVIDCQ